jgi:hypothetical protein
MRLSRTRGAVSGLALVLAGLWAALVPFFGPYLNLSIGSDHTWQWSVHRLWLDVLPGVVAVLAGVILIAAVTRRSAALGSWLAVVAGAWLIVGQSVSFLWHHGTSAAGQPLFGNAHRAVEEIVYFYGVGALILLFGAFALGRLALPAAAVPRADEVGRGEPVVGEPVVEQPETVPDAAEEPTVVRPREP